MNANPNKDQQTGWYDVTDTLKSLRDLGGWLAENSGEVEPSEQLEIIHACAWIIASLSET
jgi:hypothetical protein